MATDADIRTLHREVTEVERKHPDLSLDNAFVHWFLTAYLVESEKSLNGAIVGGANDKGVDAIYVDHDNEKVFLVQGKYHIAKSPHAETHSDVMSFAGLAKTLHGEKSDLENLLANADPVVRDGLRKIWRFFRHRGYGLELYYVSTGKISPSLDKEAQHYVSMASDRAEFYAFGKEKILKLLKDWLDGAAPPVPLLDLPVEVREGLRGGGMIERYDRSTGIESWVFSMLASDIGRMYTRAKTRLFARNIRGFLGSTEINRGMRNTLRTQPENFWYFNNGVTVVCDGAKRITEHGKETLRVFNPQVINGQQTTRVLEEGGRNARAFSSE